MKFLQGIIGKCSVVSRYMNRNNSSLSFWWLPVKKGRTGERGMEQDYFVDFSSKADYEMLFDNQGVMMLDYLGEIGKQYNPCAVAQYGLGLISRYLEKRDEKDLRRAVIQADWLINCMKYTEKNIARLEYEFKYDGYKMIQEEHYISGIAQAQAMSFLIRIYRLTGNEKYRKGVEGLFQSFLYPIMKGGVINYDEEGRLYIEEILTEKVSCVLDGFMYGIFGVYDYYLFTKDKRAEKIWRKACFTLEEILPEFDLKFWSRADCYLKSPKMPASAFYHNVHIHQLEAIFEITKKDVFKFYAEKWLGYQNNWIYRQLAFLYKCWFKLFYY